MKAIAQLNERAVLVRLSISCLNIKRTDKKVTDEVLARHMVGKDGGEFRKNLVQKEAIEKLVQSGTEWRDWHYKQSLCWKDEGYRILPTINLAEYNDGTRQRRMKREALVEEFVEAWPSLVERARVELNGMFNEADYPHIEDLPGKFATTVEFSPVPSAGDFRINVATEMLEEMKESTNNAIMLAQEQAVKDVWVRLSKPLLHLANKMKEADGKFRDSIIGNILEVAELAPKLNILGDERLDGFAQEIRNAFGKTDPNVLRTSAPARAAAQQKADDILARMAGYCV